MIETRRPIRVCFFNRSYWPDTGATGQLLTELAEDLAAMHGFEVTVVAGSSSNGAPRREIRNGVTIVRAAGTQFTPSVFAGRVSNYLSYFASALLHALKLPKQDVVVALTDPPVIGLAALTAARGGAPFVFFCQDIFPEVGALVESFRSRVVDRFLEQVNRLLVRRADRIVALGETMAARLRTGKGANADRIAVIHNWADTTAIVPGAKQNPFAAAHGLVSRFVVLHAGNIGLAQNLETVLEAASLVKDMPDVLFLFIGDGSQRAALEARARERRLANVRFLPFQPRDQMRWTYASADVCLVSLKAGLSGYIVPSKLYPILAAGRAYIAAVDSTSEVTAITERFQCGVVTPAGDAAALAAAVGRLRGDCETRTRMATAGRAAAIEFDRARQVSAHAVLLRDVVETRKHESTKARKHENTKLNHEITK
jgi:colanic acid biosynthesis glycosyl transferase WcaI